MRGNGAVAGEVLGDVPVGIKGGDVVRAVADLRQQPADTARALERAGVAVLGTSTSEISS